MIKIIAVLCNPSSPINCHEQIVSTSGSADLNAVLPDGNGPDERFPINPN